MTELAAAYGTSAAAWARGPDRVYRRLAEAMLAHTPVPITGPRVLDIGAGTGAVPQAARAAGVRDVVAGDVAQGMLRAIDVPGVRRVVADALALPFRDGAFDLVTAACVLGHLLDPERGLRECRRVSGSLVATSFLAGWQHPAKTAVDDAMSVFGFRPPAWYVTMKSTTEPLADDPDHLRSLAARVGWDPVVRVIDVPSGLHTPAEVASWRLGMAHLAPFVASLPPATRTAAIAAAGRAVQGVPEPVIPLVVLSAR